VEDYIGLYVIDLYNGHRIRSLYGVMLWQEFTD